MRKRTIVLALGAILALLVGAQVALASHGVATLTGSNFEIDNDANLKLDDGTAFEDWGVLAHPNGPELRATDLATGQNDNSYKGGVKEDTECPGEVTGSIPNNKSDLLTFHVYEEAGAAAGDPGFINLAWSRVSDPSGTTLMDFEFNQADLDDPADACAQGPNVQRTTGDLLIEYAIDQGGARADISGRFWNGSAWGPSQDLDAPSLACADPATPTVPQPCAVGTINQSVIPAAESDGLGEKQARTFGEAQIDLDLIFNENECTTFGAAMLKSRSSDAFTSQLKDFIEPIPVDLTNCGKVIIHKETNPDTSPTTGPEFTYQHNLATDPTQADNPATANFNESTHFKLRDEGTQTFTNVLFGTYSVQELLGTSLPTGGWEFLRVDCAKDAPETGDNPLANVTPNSITGAVVAFTIDSDTDVLECTYTNQQRVSTISTAQSVYPNDTATVTGTLGGGTPTGNVTFELYGPDTTPNNAADNCTGTADYTQTVALTSGSASTTNGVPADGQADFAIADASEGTYWWKVSYAGDTNNPAVSSCVESTAVTINNGQPVSSS